MTRFDTTRWSIILRARGASSDARAALESLCRRYRPPVLAYIRRRGHDADDAEDLAQSFFTYFVEHACHADADPARGRFRAFLLTALRRFLVDAHEEARALKRGGAFQFTSLDPRDGGDMLEQAGAQSPEDAFERDWAATVLEAALARLRAEAAQASKQRLFDQLREFLLERPDEADYERLATRLDLRRNTLAVAVHRLRHRLRELVRAELAETTADRQELETELRHLRAAFNNVMA